MSTDPGPVEQYDDSMWIAAATVVMTLVVFAGVVIGGLRVYFGHAAEPPPAVQERNP